MISEKNRTQFSEVSLPIAAIVAGLGLLAMTPLAIFANSFVLQNLVIANDAKATVANIAASSGLFRIGIVCFLLVAVLDVVVAWALYLLLEPVNRGLSMLAAWFRVIYAAVFAVAFIPLLSVLQLVSGADYLKGLEANQIQAQVMMSLSTFRSGWDLALVLFGFHLLVLGYLAFNSGFIPKWLGILLVIAGLGYMVDSFGKFLIPNYNVSIAMFTFVGEFLLIFWLLWKGFASRAEVQPRGVRQ